MSAASILENEGGLLLHLIDRMRLAEVADAMEQNDGDRLSKVDLPYLDDLAVGIMTAHWLVNRAKQGDLSFLQDFLIIDLAIAFLALTDNPNDPARWSAVRVLRCWFDDDTRC